MTPQPKVVKVSGFLKNYAWGRLNGLSEFMQEPSPQPQAELWFGNHKSGPSLDLATGLSVAIEPAAPLLVKLLAISQPLSIQVHPDENFAIANYEKLKLSDKNGKDEIIVALETVWAFAGIKSMTERKRILGQLDLSTEITDFKEQSKEILLLNAQQVTKKIDLLIQSIEDEVERKAFKFLVEYYPNDRGVLIAGLLQFHILNPGEALHVPPGCPHEYLSGIALEVMTNSDNVFRMGLTIKPLDIEHSLQVITENKIEKFAKGERYKPKAIFEILDLTAVKSIIPASSYRVLLCLEGEVKIQSGPAGYGLKKGEALLITDSTEVEVEVNGRAVVAMTTNDGRL